MAGGEVFARVIQECLQVVAEKVLPESQCGKERGCCDMIFVARQLLEKAREHQERFSVHPLCRPQKSLQLCHDGSFHVPRFNAVERWGYHGGCEVLDSEGFQSLWLPKRFYFQQPYSVTDEKENGICKEHCDISIVV